MIETVLDEEKRGTRRKEGRGEKRDGEEGGTRRKDGQGGSRDGEEGGKRRVKEMKKLLKNER